MIGIIKSVQKIVFPISQLLKCSRCNCADLTKQKYLHQWNCMTTGITKNTIINNHYQQSSSILTSFKIGSNTNGPNYVQTRSKFDRKRSKKGNNDDEDGNRSTISDFSDLADGKDNKIVEIKVTSLRADLLIKSALGMARNKVEAAFYDSKIRINGKKIAKKSVSIKSGDEVDVVREFSPLNPAEHIIVSRIEILSITPNVDTISIVIRRFKSLTIENYESENVWKSYTV